VNLNEQIVITDRTRSLAIALRLEIVTIIWMVIEAAAAVGAGIAARSLLLVAFGIDSAIELASAVVVFRRFQIEKFAGDFDDGKGIERKVARVAGYLLLLLSAYILLQAGFGLVTRHAAETSPVGIARHPAPSSCNQEPTLLALTNKSIEPAHSISAGTSAMTALINALSIQ
jgi:hypothetical protein